MALIGGTTETVGGPELGRCYWLRLLGPIPLLCRSTVGHLVRGHALLSDLNVEVKQGRP
jgi:hypothetical protein